MIEPFEPLARKDHDALAAEGERLVRFVAEQEGAEAFEVRFTKETYALSDIRHGGMPGGCTRRTVEKDGMSEANPPVRLTNPTASDPPSSTSALALGSPSGRPG